MTGFDAIIYQFILKVENQLQEDNPPAVRQTLARLKSLGYDETEAKLMMAQCIAVEMYTVFESNEPYNQARYVSLLEKLPDLPESKA